jgi:hypothetical protein
MIDLLIQMGIAPSFVIFAICLWLLKREKQKQKSAKGQKVAPLKLPGA